MEYYEIRKQFYDKYGFSGFEAYPEKFNTFKEAKRIYDSFDNSRLCIFKIKVTETKIL